MFILNKSLLYVKISKIVKKNPNIGKFIDFMYICMQ